MTELMTTARNMDLTEARDVLEAQHAAKYDLVAPSSTIQYWGGVLQVLADDGVYHMHPTDQFEKGVSSRLDIPRRYLRRLRDDAEETGEWGTLDRNVNHWLDRSRRNWFVRGFKLGENEDGIARAFLSDKYNCIDHIDALFATLDGVAAAGVRGISVGAVDLSEKSIRVKIEAPSIQALAPAFLRNYRSPWDGRPGSELPVISAGLIMANSETGAGAYTLAPRIKIEVCKNGMTRTEDAYRKVHLGERMGEGTIDWSMETRHAGIDLIKNQTRDAVTTFLSQSYLQGIADELEASAGVEFDKPTKAVEHVAKQMKYSDDERDRIEGLFMKSGDPSAGGIVNAVTAFAQTVEDPDRAAELEEDAFAVLSVAKRFASV